MTLPTSYVLVVTGCGDGAGAAQQRTQAQAQAQTHAAGQPGLSPIPWGWLARS